MALPVSRPALGTTTAAKADEIAKVIAPIASPAEQRHFTGAVGYDRVAQLGSTPPVVKVAASGAAQTLAVPAYGGVAYDVTLTANCTFTLTGWTAGIRQTIHLLLRQDATGGRAVTLPAGVKWSNNATLAFVTAALGLTEISLTSFDGGVTIVAK